MSQPEHTADVVARWMLEQVQNEGLGLYQEDAAWNIKNKFGPAFVYDNENGNLAIDKKVLAAFKKISGNDVVWEKGEKCWRKRKHYYTVSG